MSNTKEKWLNSILKKFSEEKRKEFDKKLLCLWFTFWRKLFLSCWV